MVSKKIKAVKLYNANAVIKNVSVNYGVKSDVDVVAKNDIVVPMVDEDKKNFVTVMTYQKK